MTDTQQAPKQPNPYGHVWGKGFPTDDGYARCHRCGCRENTDQSLEDCRTRLTLFGKEVIGYE